MTDWLVTFRSHAGQVNETFRVVAEDVVDAVDHAGLELAVQVQDPTGWGFTDAVEVLCEPPPPSGV